MSYNQCMGFFKKLQKASIATYKAAKAVNDAVQEQKQKSQPTSNSRSVQQNKQSDTSNQDYKELLALYKSYSFSENFDILPLIKTTNPYADPSTCPYCGVKHEFIAKRARKCPDCGEQMIVRKGFFLTEQQVEELESAARDEYARQYAWSRLEGELKSVQNYRIEKQPVYLRTSLAKAFQHAAKLNNAKNAKGFDYWDRAWSYFNEARIEEMRQYDGYYSQLPSISYDMADMLVDQAKNTVKPEAQKRQLKRALQQVLMSIGETVQFDDDVHVDTYIYERAKLIARDACISDQAINEEAQEIANTLRLNPQQAKVFTSKINEIKTYEIIGNRELY